MVRGAEKQVAAFVYWQSPIGWLRLSADQKALTGIEFCREPGSTATASPVLREAVRQLQEYFSGQRKVFDLPLHFKGTAFQEKVWAALCEIPFGQTASYQEIARKIGHPQSMRAVGAANGRNPIPIIVPCHRVIGADGRLVGYSSGLWRKEWLLNHEKQFLP